MDVASAAIALLIAMEWVVLAYFLGINTTYLVLLLSAARELTVHTRTIRGESRGRLLGSRLAPRVSVLAPAYNEEATIEESVRALLALHYPRLEVVVVSDGSKDRTVERLVEAFDLVPVPLVYRNELATARVKTLYRSRAYPSLVVADKENGGKADALNAGLDLSSGDLVCAIDADTLIEPDSLLRMVRPFVTRPDVVATGGTIRVANGATIEGGTVRDVRLARHPLAVLQTMEYLRAFLFGRLGWNRLGGNIIISGAFGLFDRDAMLAVGGYAHDTVGEDMEVVVRLRRRGVEEDGPSRVDFVPDPVAWTEVPESLRTLARQRDRWHRGLSDSLLRHRRMFLNPRYGALGTVVTPYFVLGELAAPVVEAVGLLGLAAGLWLGAVSVDFAILFFLVAYGYGMVLNVATLLLETTSFRRYRHLGDVLRLLLWSLLETFGYRQLTVWWRLKGIVSFLRGSREWGAQERKGLARS